MVPFFILNPLPHSEKLDPPQRQARILSHWMYQRSKNNLFHFIII